MTSPDTVALDRWTSPVWDAVSDSFTDPLERVMLVALVLVSACLLLVLATQQDAASVPAREACVVQAVDEARAFARVLGDDRVASVSFAEQACSRP